MPIPWKSRCTRIPSVEHRAITIHQLRDLSVFVQRLCKTQLLRSKERSVVPFSEVNMYYLADLIIKPAIEYEERKRKTDLRYSWVEFVADAAQLPRLMFSHSWFGRFRDFMASVKELGRSHGVGGSFCIWICTFANSQFGEDFGAGLRDSPFYKAVQIVEDGLILIVDRDASSLQRIWCGLELHLSLVLAKRLEIFTSAGQVGVTVTNGPLVESVEAWDVTRMEASQDSDRRQILNYLCRGELHERDGLKKDEHGNLALVDGWRKTLDGVETTANTPLRLSGQEEYVHEGNLFLQFADKFAQLNTAVRQKVLLAAQASDGIRERHAQKMSLECRGITLGELRTVVKKLKAFVSLSDAYSWDSLTVAVVAEQLMVLPAFSPDGYCYAEFVSPSARTPQYVIDDVFQDSWASTISAVEWFAEARQLSNSAVLWWAPFCVDSRRVQEESQNWDSAIRTVISNCEGWLTVLPRDRELIVRSNRMQQLQICFETGRQIDLCCPHGVLSCTSPFLDGAWEFGRFDPAIARVLIDANWEEATCANKEVQERIKAQVRDAPGGFAGFKARLSRVIAGPILRDAVSKPGSERIDEILKICRMPGFNINNAAMKGPLGETPLHVAAAVGNAQAIRVLLAHNADPYAEDNIRETPLHYAALSGMVGATRLLLKGGAASGAESAFAETALTVAKQNPAAFLGKDPSKVITLLLAWEGAEAEEMKEQAEAEAEASTVAADVP